MGEVNRIVERMAPATALQHTLAGFLASHVVMMSQGNAGMRSRGYAYASIYEYLLEHGRWMVRKREQPAGLDELLLELSDRLEPQQRGCYANAQRAVLLTGGRLRYAEGLAMPRGLIPVWHGWTMLNGQVWDPTFDLLPYRPTAYWGCAFDVAELAEHLARTRAHTSVIDNYRDRWPLLRQRRETTHAAAAARRGKEQAHAMVS
jgi:hypothetical protein